MNGADIRVHPNLFHSVLEPTNAPWQVIREPEGIRVLVAGAVNAADVARMLERGLVAAGVAPLPLLVTEVSAIPRTALGKAPLVRVEVRAR